MNSTFPPYEYPTGPTVLKHYLIQHLLYHKIIFPHIQESVSGLFSSSNHSTYMNANSIVLITFTLRFKWTNSIPHYYFQNFLTDYTSSWTLESACQSSMKYDQSSFWEVALLQHWAFSSWKIIRVFPACGFLSAPLLI